MRLTIVCLTAVGLTLAACQPAAETTTDGTETPAVETPATTPADSNALTPAGWGPLRIGMTLDEVNAAAGPDSDPGSVGGPEPEQCDQFRPERAPEGLLVMIEQGVLTSISAVRDSALTTDRGFGIGARAAYIKAAYGDQAIVEPHRYVEGGEYITVWQGQRPADYVQDASARGVRYETNAEGAVTTIHVGGPSIQYVEGCA